MKRIYLTKLEAHLISKEMDVLSEEMKLMDAFSPNYDRRLVQIMGRLDELREALKKPHKADRILAHDGVSAEG